MRHPVSEESVTNDIAYVGFKSLQITNRLILLICEYVILVHNMNSQLHLLFTMQNHIHYMKLWLILSFNMQKIYLFLSFHEQWYHLVLHLRYHIQLPDNYHLHYQHHFSCTFLRKELTTPSRALENRNLENFRLSLVRSLPHWQLVTNEANKNFLIQLFLEFLTFTN